MPNWFDTTTERARALVVRAAAHIAHGLAQGAGIAVGLVIALNMLGL